MIQYSGLSTHLQYPSQRSNMVRYHTPWSGTMNEWVCYPDPDLDISSAYSVKLSCLSFSSLSLSALNLECPRLYLIISSFLSPPPLPDLKEYSDAFAHFLFAVTSHFPLPFSLSLCIDATHPVSRGNLPNHAVQRSCYSHHRRLVIMIPETTALPPH